MFDFWLRREDKPYQDLAARLVEIENEQAAIRARGTVAHIMQERPETPKAYVLFRGDYDKRREEVGAGHARRAFRPCLPNLPRNRLGFARWLVRPEHPLTARVTVNRFWQEVFGIGLVKTSEDFGVNGETPVNQELLDWLAVDFRESGWDVKRLFRLMVTSAAYRQSAAVTPEKLERDPENRLISRGPRFRMDAEMVRDYALAASGLLVTTIGGPSVRPYQPDGVWEAVAMPESNTRYYTADSGERLYRRSMYTLWKRAAPPASMDIFNAPSREVVHGPPRADEHAAPGPGDAQRPAVRRSGAAFGGDGAQAGRRQDREPPGLHRAAVAGPALAATGDAGRAGQSRRPAQALPGGSVPEPRTS